MNHETHGHVTVPRDRPETNVGGGEALRHVIGHVCVAVVVSCKRHRVASRVSNVAPVVRGGCIRHPVSDDCIRHPVWRHPFVIIVTSLCSDRGHPLYTVIVYTGKPCLNPRVCVATVSWPRTYEKWFATVLFSGKFGLFNSLRTDWNVGKLFYWLIITLKFLYFWTLRYIRT